MKIKLVSYWRKWWKLWSVWISAIGITLLSVITYLPGIYYDVMNNLPPDIRAALPPELLQKASIVIWVIAIFAKFIKQEKLTKEVENGKDSKTSN